MRDAEGGNQTHVKELYAIISLQLLITPADFSAFVTRERSLFYAPIRQCSEFSSRRARIAYRYRVQLYHGISNSIGASFTSDALPSTSLVHRGF